MFALSQWSWLSTGYRSRTWCRSSCGISNCKCRSWQHNCTLKWMVKVSNYQNREITEAKEFCQTRYKFPTDIGANDCTHIGIFKSKLHGDKYINRKGKVIEKATCVVKEMFTCVDASCPGSMHDSSIRKNLIMPHDCNSKSYARCWVKI